MRGSPGESIFENLKLVLFLEKSFTPIEESSESQSKDQEVKDTNTTQWRRGPVRHTAMLVKKTFPITRLDFGQGVGKGDSYRQSALIPTSDGPDSMPHQSSM